MKKEELFEGIGTLDDELLKRSEQSENMVKKRRNFNRIMKYGSIAACLLAVLSAGVIFMNANKEPDSDMNPEADIVAEGDDNVFNEQSRMQEESEPYVDVAMLLASNEGIEEQALTFSRVAIEEYCAIYYKVASVDSITLKESIGSEVEGAQDWYKVSGHEDMQYLIFSDNDEYSLWEFDSFQDESYAYKDVLQMIYNICSAEDITEIIVAPATMDNTDEGKAIQNEIGTNIITDDKDIETLYNVLSGLTCYGSDHWDMIGLGDDSPSGMQNQVRAGRYLTLTTAQGMKIDTLKYTGISGMFYEYGGIAYSALTMEEKSAVEEILNIELKEAVSDVSMEQENVWETHVAEENNDSVTGNSTQDVPVDENSYREAGTYPEELTDLQNRISEAMMNKELPFVISSAIRENPDRVQVVVTTKDENLIAKLEAFDVTGELLEIEYSESTATLELQELEVLKEE